MFWSYKFEFCWIPLLLIISTLIYIYIYILALVGLFCTRNLQPKIKKTPKTKSLFPLYGILSSQNFSANTSVNFWNVHHCSSSLRTVYLIAQICMLLIHCILRDWRFDAPNTLGRKQSILRKVYVTIHELDCFCCD